MSLVTVSSKGQIVIPKDIRKDLHIKPKQRVLLKMVKDHAEIIPMPDDPVEAFCGIFRDGPSLVNALLNERKEEQKREEKSAARTLRSADIPDKRWRW